MLAHTSFCVIQPYLKLYQHFQLVQCVKCISSSLNHQYTLESCLPAITGSWNMLSNLFIALGAAIGDMSCTYQVQGGTAKSIMERNWSEQWCKMWQKTPVQNYGWASIDFSICTDCILPHLFFTLLMPQFQASCFFIMESSSWWLIGAGIGVWSSEAVPKNHTDP